MSTFRWILLVVALCLVAGSFFVVSLAFTGPQGPDTVEPTIVKNEQ